MTDIQVQQLMTHLVVMLFPNESLWRAAERMARNGVGGAPVVEEGKVVGLLSAADVMRAARRGEGDHLDSLTAAEVMTRPAITVGPTTSVWEAADVMERRRIKRLPVVDDEGYLIGIISRGDIVRLVAKQPGTPVQAV